MATDNLAGAYGTGMPITLQAAFRTGNAANPGQRKLYVCVKCQQNFEQYIGMQAGWAKRYGKGLGLCALHNPVMKKDQDDGSKAAVSPTAG